MVNLDLGKSEYVQLTVRIPPKLYEILVGFARERSLSLQDAMLVILLDYFGLIGGGEE